MLCEGNVAVRSEPSIALKFVRGDAHRALGQAEPSRASGLHGLHMAKKRHKWRIFNHILPIQPCHLPTNSYPGGDGSALMADDSHHRSIRDRAVERKGTWRSATERHGAVAHGSVTIIGSADDVRGDDINLHWYRNGTNNPFVLAATVDFTTYSRTLGSLPLRVGQHFCLVERHPLICIPLASASLAARGTPPRHRTPDDGALKKRVRGRRVGLRRLWRDKSSLRCDR